MDCTKCNWPTPESCRICKAEEKERQQRELSMEEKEREHHQCDPRVVNINGEDVIARYAFEEY